METSELLSNFESTVRSAVHPPLDDKAILRNFNKLRRVSPMLFDPHKANQIINQRSESAIQLADNYITARLGAQFPLINEELFTIKRTIRFVCGEDRKWTIASDAADPGTAVSEMNKLVVQIPMFLRASLKPGSKENVDVGDFRKESTGVYTTTIKVTVKRPFTHGVAITQMKRRAVSAYYSAIAKLMSSQAGDMILHDSFNAPEFEVCWIPTLDSFDLTVLQIPIPQPAYYDPALIMVARERPYLAGMWDIKQEEPFEAYLREFTSGDFRKVPKTTQPVNPDVL